MVFFSQLLHRPVVDVHNQKVGDVADLVVSLDNVFPTVKGLVVSTVTRLLWSKGRDSLVIPWTQVTNLEEGPVYLNVSLEEMESYQLQGGDVLLGRDILDKQIVDTHGCRIVKVNDVKLAQIHGVARLIGADISLRGFLRRLGIEGISQILPIKLPERVVTWNYIEPLETETSDVRLVVPHTKLAELRPADIADVIEKLEVEEGVVILGEFPEQTAAEVLGKLEPPMQTALVEGLDEQRASDLLEIMAPDEAVDILRDLPPAKADELLSMMDREEAAEVRDLLRYGEHTAGGIMTSDFFALQGSMTAEEVLRKLRTEVPHAEVVYYLFVIDEDRRLIGVVSLRDLVTADPDTRMERIMDKEVIQVHVKDDREAVAQVISKYELLAVPVVDDGNHMLGLVTVDDIIDVIREETNEDISQMAGTSSEDVGQTGPWWRAAAARMEWMAFGLVGGAIAGLILRSHASSLQSLLPLVYFIPLMLLVSNGVVRQSLAVVGRIESLGWGRNVLWREIQIGAIISFLAGLVTLAISYAFFGKIGMGIVAGSSLTVTLLAAVVIGGLLPLTLRRLGLSPTLLGAPVIEPVVGIASLLIYLGLFSNLWRHLL